MPEDLVTDAAVIPVSAMAAATRVANPDAIRAVEGNLMDTVELVLSAVRAAAPHIAAAALETEAARQDRIATEFGEKAATFEGPKDFVTGYLAAVEDLAVGLRVRAAELKGTAHV